MRGVGADSDARVPEKTNRVRQRSFSFDNPRLELLILSIKHSNPKIIRGVWGTSLAYFEEL